MAIYNASLLISASNATYFTNVTGGIAAVAVRSLNDSWISSSALLSGSNTFVGNQIISGNVDINGTITASLQTGYLYVGDSSGKTQAVATSSIITNIATGSFATTGSNTFYGNQIISGNVLPLVDGQGDLGTDTYKWNQVVVNGQLKGSSLNTTGRGAVGTLRVGDETFPLSFLSDREIVGDGTGANTHMYYGTSSADVTALREIVYTQSGSNADFGNVSASFNTRIDNLSGITGSFATTGSNTFTGNQYIYSTSGATPLVISSSAYYGIQLQNQGIQIQGSGGPRIQFPNKAWLNGNENDEFQFTADTDDPLTRGLDFYLYGSGSRNMRFRNNSGPGASIQFSSTSGSITFQANNNNMSFNAGGFIEISGSQTNINGLRYPQTDGTSGQAIITNGSGILSFGNVSINTGSFATTGSNTFTGNQTISTTGNSILNLIAQPGFQTNVEFQSENSNFEAYGDFNINNHGQFGGSGSIDILVKDNHLVLAADQGIRMGVTNGIGNAIDGSGFVTINVPSGSQQFQLTGSLVVSNTLTASLQEGYAWVGGAGNISTLVATSSFGGGGVSGSFATLGSNTFTGSQTILNAPLNLTNTGSAFFTMYSPSQNNILLQSPNTVFTTYGDFNFNNNGGMGGSGSLVFTAASNSVQITGDNGTLIQGLKYPTTDGTNGQVITTNGSGVLSFTTISGGATGSYATLGANTFTGSQTISASNGALTFSQTGSSAGGIQFPNSKIYQNNFLNFEANGVGVDFSVAGTNPSTNINFRNTSTSGQIQFTTDSSSISLRAATSVTISGSSVNIYGSGGGGITNRGVVSIGQTIGTSVGENYLLGYSGSLVLSNNSSTPTYAGLSHITASNPNTNTNLIFKVNNNTGTTITSGSANIFTNPATPTTGYIRYVGFNNNLYLNNQNGVSTQITSSAASVSGVRPTMNNNIFNGTGNFTINQANNPGSHTYSHNIIGGVGNQTINALAFTGSLNLLSNIVAGGSITANPASASTAEIASGLSGSGTLTMNNNGIFGGGITSTSPRILGVAQTQATSNNVIAGTSVTVTNISSSFAVAASQNITNNTMAYSNAAASAIHTSAGNMSTSYGGVSINAIGSAVGYTQNVSLGSMTIINNSFSGSAGGGLMSANRNLFQGQQHSYITTGSTDAGGDVVNMSDNSILGKQNTIFINSTGAGAYNSFNGNVVGGYNLIVTGSNSFALQEGGGAYFGRYNANDGVRNRTGQNVFLVGTGNATTRKTGFLIDSGSNSFFEGSLNVSGATTLNGNTSLTGSLTISSSNSIDLQVIGTAQVSSSVGYTTISSNNFTQLDNTNSVTNNLNTYGFSTIFGTGGNAFSELGFTNNGASYGISGWNGPSIYINDTTDTYPAVLGFQQKSDYTDGRVTALTPLVTSGSLIANSYTILTSVSASLNFADDTAAAAGGVPLGGLYRNGNFVMIRLT